MALSFFSWLHAAAPAFPVDANKIRFLKDPDEFYQTLLEKCSTARHRIVLSSLYLGTGQLEKTLVSKKFMQVFLLSINQILYLRGSLKILAVLG